MRRYLAYLFTGLALGGFLILACKNTAANQNPAPDRVQLVEKTPDTAAVERGIDAEYDVAVPDSVGNGIYLEWYPVTNTRIKAYDIYRREVDTTGSFTKIAEVPQAFGAVDTSYLDIAVQLRVRYYYYVIARGEDDQEGEPSRIDHYMLLPKPEQLNSPTNNALFNGVFSWTFAEEFVPLYFVFRLEKQMPGEEYVPYYVRGFTTEGNLQPEQRWSLNDLGLPPLEPGNYRWRIDVRTLDPDQRRGSESEWGYFWVQ